MKIKVKMLNTEPDLYFKRDKLVEKILILERFVRQLMSRMVRIIQFTIIAMLKLPLKPGIKHNLLQSLQHHLQIASLFALGLRDKS